jgi:RNA-directed DNA polymerase
VEETDRRGHVHRTTRNRDTGRGTPQGAPLSPLLSNLYMRRFVVGWKTFGCEERLDAHIVNYADDFVICCRGTAEEAERTMRALMARLKLTVNDEKTRVCHLPDDSFDFLGYTIGTRPSKTRVQRICQDVRERTDPRWTWRDAGELVEDLNRKLRGWANYFILGPVSKAYRAVDSHVKKRLRQWLCRKHKKRGRGIARYPDQYLYETLGLIRLPSLTRDLPWANA